MSVKHKSDGFSGKAGPGWSDEDLRSNKFAALCPQGSKVADLKITRSSKGKAKFTGRCVK